MQKGESECHELLLLHGFMGDSRDWTSVKDSLPDEWGATAPDLPWHGHCAGVRPESWDTLIDRIIANYIACSSHPIHLVGYSMGGRFALGIAAKAPDKIASLTLISSAIGLASVAERKKRIEHDSQIATAIKSEDLQQFLENWYSLPLFGTLSARTADFQNAVAARLSNNPSALADCLDTVGTGRMPHFAQFLQSTSIPIQYLAGEQDKKFANLAASLKAEVPAIAMRVINGAAHALLNDAPTAVAKCLIQHIENINAPTPTIDRTSK